MSNFPKLSKKDDELSQLVDAGPFSLSPEQEAELERRIEYNRQHPDDVVGWENVKERLRQRA